MLQLQEKGKLNVNDLVSKYVSDSPETWKDITIHHLLTHTSGLHGSTELPDSASHLSSPDQDACVIVLSNMPSPRFGPIGRRLAVMLLGDSSAH